MRSGMVAIVGRPNVGKSSLLNALIGQKVAIVSHKPQTTRNRIQGVLHAKDAQIAFIDTPGIHALQSKALNRAMNESAIAALEGVDVVLFVVDATKWTDEDAQVLERLRGVQTPIGLVVNKVDYITDKTKLFPTLEKLSGMRDYAFVVPLSALKRQNLEPLKKELIARLPEGPPLYPEGQITGHDRRFAAAEIVREKLTRSLHQELPYALAVEIEQYEETAKVIRIEAVIWVEREGQKAIVIGAGGATLKGVGTTARKEIERTFGRKVFLKLWCRVKENWSDDPAALKKFGLSAE
ncbi:MAG TPA: GTPase Era [Nevskiaceae bacterium]|nr:GTPase Era [Nevskiaceae bacterium]